MLAMTIKAISVAGMGCFFMDEKEVDKMEIAYETVSKSLAAVTIYWLIICLRNVIVLIDMY